MSSTEAFANPVLTLKEAFHPRVVSYRLIIVSSRQPCVRPSPRTILMCIICVDAVRAEVLRAGVNVSECRVLSCVVPAVRCCGAAVGCRGRVPVGPRVCLAARERPHVTRNPQNKTLYKTLWFAHLVFIIINKL